MTELPALSVPFVLAATEHGPLILSHIDFHVPESGPPIGVGMQLLTNGRYDSIEAGLIKSLLSLRRDRLTEKRRLLALDCGANIGVMTVEMARHMRDWGIVIAFEAQERLFYALCGNIALANLFNAKAQHCALGAATGKTRVPFLNY